MSLFLETLDTIYYTIIGMTTRFIRAIIRESTEPPEVVDTDPVQSVLDPVDIEKELVPSDALHDPVPSNLPVEEPETFKPVHEILKTEAYTPSGVEKNTIMYSGTVDVPVYMHPTIEFDTQKGSIPYGEMVMVLEPKGRFLKVVWNTLEGWVLRDDLADRAIRVYPEFVVGKENLVDHSNTAHVRTLLGDIFGLGRSEFALQAGEYVLYRLWRKGIRVTWPDTKPRVPGLWHKLLKGGSGIHIGVMPRVGSIMEYMLTPDMGHLAYVEAVFPDTTITISEVNYPDSGIYNERELRKEEWTELKPIFISIT